MVAGAVVLRRNDAPVFDALMMRGGAVVMRVICGQTPATNLPQGTVTFIMVWGLFVALQAVGK